MKSLALKSLPILALIILTIIFFGQTLTGQEIFATPDFGGSDIFDAEYPTKYFLSESLKQRRLPILLLILKRIIEMHRVSFLLFQ